MKRSNPFIEGSSSSRLRLPPAAPHVKRQAFQAMPEDFKREGNRKHLYIRSTKLARSKQLVIDSPRVIEVQL